MGSAQGLPPSREFPSAACFPGSPVFRLSVQLAEVAVVSHRVYPHRPGAQLMSTGEGGY